MKHILLSIILLTLCSMSGIQAQFSAAGGIGEPYKHAATGGLQSVYIFNTLAGATLTYTSSNPSINFVKYNSSIASAVPVPASDITIASNGSNTNYTISNLTDAWGYLAQQDSKAVWIIDYSLYPLVINSVIPEMPEDEAERCKDRNLNLRVDKIDPALQYRATSGGVQTIARLYQIEYNDTKWDDASMTFVNFENKIENKEISNIVSIIAPLKDSNFTISGDQFARHFKIAQSKTSDDYKAVAIEVHMLRKLMVDGMETDSTEIGDSAPLELRFYAHANTPAADFYEWWIYKNGDHDNYIVRYTGETDIRYIFTEAGKYDVVLEVSSQNRACVAREMMSFEIAESSLEIPNYFSPGNSPGINDVFKVKHKSLVKFKATIFNRWENKIYEWSDPDEGWDGKYKGKYVNPGVYFYVIDAIGSEGRKYKKGGSINILRSK